MTQVLSDPAPIARYPCMFANRVLHGTSLPYVTRKDGCIRLVCFGGDGLRWVADGSEVKDCIFAWGSGNSATAVPRATVAQARWRWSAEADGYVPDRRSAAGRAVATDLDARGGNTLARREQWRLNAEFDARN